MSVFADSNQIKYGTTCLNLTAGGDTILTAVTIMTRQKKTHLEEKQTMSREVGERYRCDSCKAELVYEVACPCEGMPHSEICCGKQMTKVEA
jgi:hypothetical protein